jgi:hypothetical protein
MERGSSVQIHKKGLTILLIALLSISAFLGLSLSIVNAQLTPYTVNGSVSPGWLDYYWISNVKQGDLFLLTVTGAGLQLFYSNLTVISTPSNIVQFIANTTSDLLLRIGPAAAGTTYNIQCSHQLSRQTMQYTAAGNVPLGGADFWSISNVTKGDLFLLVVNTLTGWGIKTELSYANLTVIDTYDTQPGSDGRFISQFYAKTTSDLLLKITPKNTNVSYSVQCTHFIPTSSPTPTSTPTPTPTPTPTITPTISAPLNIDANTGAQVTFEVPASFKMAAGNFTYDFGDGKNITTSEKTVTHKYESPGNYTFTLKLGDVSESKIIESYAVTIKNPDSSGGITLDKLVIPIIGGVSVLIIGAVLRFSYGRIHGKVRGNKNKEGPAKESK